MQRVADSGKLAIDLVAYPDVLEVEDVHPAMTYTNRYRVGGVKLTIDGSPQGKTAWLTAPYFVPPEGQSKDYRGYAAIDEKTTNDAVAKAFANGWQILVHSNGDAASDRFIEAVRLAKNQYPDVNNRPVLIHGQCCARTRFNASRTSASSRRSSPCTPSTGATGTGSRSSARRAQRTSPPPAGSWSAA